MFLWDRRKDGGKKRFQMKDGIVIPDPLAIIQYFYRQDTPLRRLLIAHSEQVRDKALAIGTGCGAGPDPRMVAAGAMLHDIGIGRCHAPAICCEGDADYIAHGVIGGAMLREYGAARGMDLEVYARICERHTGSGITAAEVIRQRLPIPRRDYLPETPAEKLICLADKFFSKSGDRREKSLDRIRSSLAKFGPEAVDRFDALCIEFSLIQPPSVR